MEMIGLFLVWCALCWIVLPTVWFIGRAIQLVLSAPADIFEDWARKQLHLKKVVRREYV